MRIAIAGDHADPEMKDQLASFVEGLGHQVANLGTNGPDRVDYPDFARKVCEAVQKGEADLGILVCGTGIGMSIAANKFRGIRAANVTLPEVAPLARQHNDANVLTLSARFVDEPTNEQIIANFLNAQFEGGRHAGRLAKIAQIEDER